MVHQVCWWFQIYRDMVLGRVVMNERGFDSSIVLSRENKTKTCLWLYETQQKYIWSNKEYGEIKSRLAMEVASKSFERENCSNVMVVQYHCFTITTRSMSMSMSMSNQRYWPEYIFLYVCKLFKKDNVFKKT